MTRLNATGTGGCGLTWASCCVLGVGVACALLLTIVSPSAGRSAALQPVSVADDQGSGTVDKLSFAPRESRLTNIAKAQLDGVALRLRDDLKAKVTVSAPARGNRVLARARCLAVQQYLALRHGIDASRMTAQVQRSAPDAEQEAVMVTVHRVGHR
jgi:hypothetical protein